MITSRAVVLLLIASLAACQPASQDAEPAGRKAGAPASEPKPPGPALPGPDAGLPGAGPRLPEGAMPKRDDTPVDTKVAAIKLSNQGNTEEHTLGSPTTSFKPTDTVYAEVETNGTAGEYTLYAKWIASDGTVLADYGMRISEPGIKRTVISLSKPDGWPSGSNSIEIAINGAKQQTATFNVP